MALPPRPTGSLTDSGIEAVEGMMVEVPQAEDFAGGRPGRDAAVIIKLPRLAYLVRVALTSMEESALESGDADADSTS